MNESRNDVLSEIEKFNEKKKDADYVQGIESRRKARIAEKRKLENEERKKTTEAKAKQAEEEKPKGKRTKRETRKYTPSKE